MERLSVHTRKTYSVQVLRTTLPCACEQRRRFVPLAIIGLVVFLTSFPGATSLTCGSGDKVKNNQCTTSLEWKSLHQATLQNVRIAVFPLGSVEGHGPHLPVGTDLILAEEVVKSAIAGLDDIYSLPPSPFGASFEHKDKPGTIAIQDENLNGLWGDVLAAVSRAGVRKIVLVNGHGGQSPNVEICIRSARFNHNVLAVSFNLQASLAAAWGEVEERTSISHTESVYGIHGGLIETSVMLHLHPNLVNMSRSENFKPRLEFQDSLLKPYGSTVSYGWRSEDLCYHGAIGDASSATSALGAAIFDRVVMQLRSLLLEVHTKKLHEVLHQEGVEGHDSIG